MADTFTPNYNMTKPEVNASRDTWGNKHNDNISIIDTALKALDTAKVNRVNVQSASFVANDKAAPAFIHTDNTVVPLATSAALTAALAALIPPKSVILWHGSVASIPAGWALCDGANGTPDLRDRFVLGSGGGNAPGTVGGAATHSHTAGGTAISTAQMPSHNHGVTDPSHTHSMAAAGAHAHYVSGLTPNSQQSNINPGSSILYAVDGTLARTTWTTENGSHTHTNYGAYTGISVNYAGGGATHTHTIDVVAHTPPFYALCYIMRL